VANSANGQITGRGGDSFGSGKGGETDRGPIRGRHIAQDLKGVTGLGFYFFATDRAPGPGEYKYLTQGIVRVGEISLAFGLGAIYVGGFVLQQHYFPRLLQLRYVRDGEVVDYPLVSAAKEQAAEDQLFEEQREMESPDTGKPPWTCASCGEGNPGNFEVCWKCEAARAGADSGKDAGK
jgi:hypothetical protein